MAAGLALLMAIACVLFVDLDGAGLAGAGIGAGLGLLNLGVGSWITMRALRRGMKSAMATLVGGFFGRLVLVVGLLFAFNRTEAVDGIAFAPENSRVSPITTIVVVCARSRQRQRRLPEGVAPAPRLPAIVRPSSGEAHLRAGVVPARPTGYHRR